MSFYVDLLSNASTNYYSDNTLSHFSNFLPEQVNLNGDWEVALTEIYHPNYFENVTDGVFYFGAYDEKNLDAALKNPATKSRLVYKYSIQPGVYKNVQQVVAAINEAIKKESPLEANTFKAQYDSVSGQTMLLIENQKWSEKGEPVYFFTFYTYSPHLLQNLGLEAIKYFAYDKITPSYPTDIGRFHTLMIYSDIVEYGTVGDVKAQLLRSIPITHRMKGDSLQTTLDYASRYFNDLQYKKLLRNNFHSIQIEIRDVSGEYVSFASLGIVKLTLHFRKLDWKDYDLWKY